MSAPMVRHTAEMQGLFLGFLFAPRCPYQWQKTPNVSRDLEGRCRGASRLPTGGVKSARILTTTAWDFAAA